MLVARRTKAVFSGLEIAVPPPDLWESERGWRSNLSLIANALIYHDYVIKPP